MSNRTAQLLLVSILISSIPAVASTIIVTENSTVTLSAGDSLLFSISASNVHNVSGIEMVLGGLPSDARVSPIPGTSGVYVSGILFTGTIESANGSISIPLIDPDATRLGLPGGDLLLTLAGYSSGSYSGGIDLLSASATITTEQASALFSSGEAIIDLHEIRGTYTFGYPGSTLANDFSATLSNCSGTESWGARVMGVNAMTPTPEPGTWNLILIGVTMIGLSIISERVRRRKDRSGR